MDITFLGGAETVTGSKYLLTHEQQNILVDCGLFQGYKTLRLRNWAPFPVNPAHIDAVVLTHAHIDHSGYLPLLVKLGFKGPIYCTAGTKDLCAILLPDCGHLQEEEAKHANQHGYSKHTPALPLYTVADAELALKQFRTQAYHKPFSLSPDLHVEFIPSGHIIGSAFVQLKQGDQTFVFSGDLGRPSDAVMRAPEQIEMADYLILESTYGNRLHEKKHPKELIKKIVNDTLNKAGSVIIPAFAVGRAQNLLYYLSVLIKERAIPQVPIYLDSPMAENATDILCKYQEDLRLSIEDCRDLCQMVTYVQSVDASRAIDIHKEPKIIISASGMATGGRILHHLKAYAPDHRNTILFTGFQAGGTRGDRMMKGEKEIKIHGQMIPIRANIEMLGNVSAHADYEEILSWLSYIKKPPKKIFITHGEPDAADALRFHIEQTFGWTCMVPQLMQHEDL